MEEGPPSEACNGTGSVQGVPETLEGGDAAPRRSFDGGSRPQEAHSHGGVCEAQHCSRVPAVAYRTQKPAYAHPRARAIRARVGNGGLVHRRPAKIALVDAEANSQLSEGAVDLYEACGVRGHVLKGGEPDQALEIRPRPPELAIDTALEANRGCSLCRLPASDPVGWDLPS